MITDTPVSKAIWKFYLDHQHELAENGPLTSAGIWDFITCEVYLKTNTARSLYQGGQEFPEYKFRMGSICSSFEEFPTHFSEIVKEIERVSLNRALETIFISDRMEDGYCDYYEWQFNF